MAKNRLLFNLGGGAFKAQYNWVLGRFAFTLAEILITLGIIGVVAAMTIPTLMTKIQEKELYSAYMRVYSILNQAYLHAEEEYGDESGWEHTSEDVYNKIRPFLKVAQDCKIGQNRVKECFPNNAKYIYFTGTNYIGGTWNSIEYPAVRLLSGESILFLRTSGLVDFVVDLNGDKKPNQIGVDLHFFSIYIRGKNNQYKVLPGADWGDSPFDNWRYCARNVTAGGTTAGDAETGITWMPGSGCGFWILKHRNMDYLHMSDDEIKAKW